MLLTCSGGQVCGAHYKVSGLVLPMLTTRIANFSLGNMQIKRYCTRKLLRNLENIDGVNQHAVQIKLYQSCF